LSNSHSDDDEHVAVDSAADAPTAVWDEESLRAAGVEMPAQEEAKQGTAPPQIETVSDTGGMGRRAGGLSWPLTIALAVGLGLAVYFLVRFLR